MIPIANPWIGEPELKLATEAIETGWLSPQGDFVPEFEREFAQFIGTKHAFATSTGTAALHLSLVAAGIGEGDEVIVPDLTYIATANVVRYVGATPVFVDVDKDTYTIDVDAVWEAITERTAAVIPVHLYGHPVDMDPLSSVAEEHDLFVLEDAAEAHGARFRDRRVGSLGDVGCFSFYGNKLLTTGQGGIITTDDDKLAERIRQYRLDGMSLDQKYFHPVIGFNYRLTNVQAAIGLGQLERFDEIFEAKRRISNTYAEELADANLGLQGEQEWATSTQWMIAPIFETSVIKHRVAATLDEYGVETRPFFYPLHDQPPYRDIAEGEFPVTTDLVERGLNLPSGPLLSDEEIRTICRLIRETI